MDTVLLFDVDNTLLDNDRLKSDLASNLDRELGRDRAGDFARLYEEVRADEDGVVDYPEVLRRFGARWPALAVHAASLVNDIAFETYLYPGALRTIDDSRSIGSPTVLSDGDPVHQVAKIARAGIAAAVAGRVLVYDHKERHVAEVVERFPALRYVMIEDKAANLARMKERLGERLLTVHVMQGHYAEEVVRGFAPDLAVASIAELVPALRAVA